MFRKMLVLSMFCLVFSLSAAFGQKEERVTPENAPPAPRNEPAPQPPPQQAPRSEPVSRPSESSPRSEPRNDSSQRNESPRSSGSENRTEYPRRSNDSESIRRSQPNTVTPTNSNDSQVQRPRENSERSERRREPNNPPVDGTTNPPNNPDNDSERARRDRPRRDDEHNLTEDERRRRHEEFEQARNERKERERAQRENQAWLEAERERQRQRYYQEQEDRRRWEQWARMNGSGIYGTGNNYPVSSGITSVSRYFNRNDVFFSSMIPYREISPESYLPFFDEPLKPEFQPLFYIFGREFFPNEFPFVTSDWVVYYEPDLDDVFINFAKIGIDKYDVMVWYAIGETEKTVNRKLKNVLQVRRPVILQRISGLNPERVYSFSVRGLPKGEYEMRLIARDGSALRQMITIK